jgi:hypothetical protein
MGFLPESPVQISDSQDLTCPLSGGVVLRLAVSSSAALTVVVSIVLVSFGELQYWISTILNAWGAVWFAVGPAVFVGLLFLTPVAALGVVGMVIWAAASLARLTLLATKHRNVENAPYALDGLVAKVVEKVTKFAIFGGMAVVGTVAWLFMSAVFTQQPLSGGLAPEAVRPIELMPLALPTALAFVGVAPAGLVPPGAQRTAMSGPPRGGPKTMSDAVKISLIFAITILIGVGAWIYFSPYHSCVRAQKGKDVEGHAQTCAALTSGFRRS